MKVSIDLPETLPIFPLPNALLLPRSRLPLHVFEPRYLAMFDDALKTDHRMIGMIQPADQGDPPGFRNVGCAGRISSFSETDDGRYLIVLAGVLRPPDPHVLLGGRLSPARYYIFVLFPRSARYPFDGQTRC